MQDRIDKDFVCPVDSFMRFVLAFCACLEYTAAAVAIGTVRDGVNSTWPDVLLWINGISVAVFCVTESRCMARVDVVRNMGEYAIWQHLKIRKSVYAAHFAGLALGMVLLATAVRTGSTGLYAAVLTFAAVHFMFNAHYAMHSQLRRVV